MKDINSNGIRVLSLFDGISIGRLALERAGIKVAEYVAYEIDNAAIRISSYNWPEIAHKGDVTTIDFEAYRGFDLLLCGSPCQDLSQMTNGRKGLEGSKSNLFYWGAKCVQLGLCRYFLFENVAGMRKEDKEAMTEILGVEPVKICSSTVSAQTRGRYYWTNLPYSQVFSHKTDAQEILEDGMAPRDHYTAVITHSDSHTGLPNRIVKDRAMQFKCYADDSATYCHTVMRCTKKYDRMVDGQRYRLDILSAVELERLQTMPDNYTKYGVALPGEKPGVKEMGYHARHQVIGNAWTTDVIANFMCGLAV